VAPPLSETRTDTGSRLSLTPSPASLRPGPRSHSDLRTHAATVLQAAWWAVLAHEKSLLVLTCACRRGFVVRAADPQCAAVRRELRFRRVEKHVLVLHGQMQRCARAERVRVTNSICASHV
jgi:hypothetical protein